jgi:hypothetical protein
MNIYLLNKSTVLADDVVQAWVPAFNKYVGLVRRWWPRAVNIVWSPVSREPQNAWKVVIADHSDQAGALGYHDFTPNGRPISYAFAADDIDMGYSVPVTITHEIAEMIADPWIADAIQVSDKYFYAKEICDPVEAENLAFEVEVEGYDPVLCSDFVLPNWFIPGSKGLFDHMKHVTEPLQILPEGYMSVFVSGKGWTQINHQNAEHDNPKDSPYSRLDRYSRDRPDVKLNV